MLSYCYLFLRENQGVGVQEKWLCSFKRNRMERENIHFFLLFHSPWEIFTIYQVCFCENNNFFFELGLKNVFCWANGIYIIAFIEKETPCLIYFKQYFIMHNIHGWDNRHCLYKYSSTYRVVCLIVLFYLPQHVSSTCFNSLTTKKPVLFFF